MIEVVWAVLRQNDRFLLAQRSWVNYVDGTWVFPGGKIDPEDTDAIAAIYRELKEEVGLEGKRFRELFHMNINEYSIQCFFCDQWCGKLKPGGQPKLACEDIIGVGWFTLAEMHALDQSLAPFVNDSLLHFSYMMQHYDHHPDEWKEPWRGV